MSGRPGQSVALEGVRPAVQQAGRILAQLRLGVGPRSAQAQPVRHTGRPGELDAAAYGPGAVQRNRLGAEGCEPRHLNVLPIHLEERAAGIESSVPPGAAHPDLVVGGGIGPDQRLIFIDATRLRGIVARVRVGEKGNLFVGAHPEVVAAADAVPFRAGEVGVRLLVEPVAEARLEQHATVVGLVVGEGRVVDGRVGELGETAGLDAVTEPTPAGRHAPPFAQVTRYFPEQRPFPHGFAPERVVLDRLGGRISVQDRRYAREFRQPGRKLEAGAGAVVVVEENAADPAPRPFAGRDQPGLPVEALLPFVLARIGCEATELRCQVGDRDSRIDRPGLGQRRELTRQQPRDAERLDQQVGLVALPLFAVARIADRCGQFRAARRPGQLQAPQLVLAVVRFQKAVRGNIAAGVERPGVIDLAPSDLLILQVVGEQGRQVRSRLPKQGQPGRDRLLRVGIRFTSQVLGHSFRVVQVRFRFGDARCAKQVVVVDEAWVGIAIDGAAKRQFAGNQRQVEGESGIRARGAAVCQREQVAADLEGASLRVRPARQVAHGPRQGTGAVKRSLGPQQHLHPLDVVEPEIDSQRNVPKIGGDAVVVIVAGELRPVQRVRVQTAGDDDVAAPRPLVHNRQAGRPAGQFRQVPDGPPLEIVAGHGRNAHRHLLQRFLEAGGCHHHSFLEWGETQGYGRQFHRIGPDGHILQSHRAEAAPGHSHRVGAGNQASEPEPATRVSLRLARCVRTAAQPDRGAG